MPGTVVQTVRAAFTAGLERAAVLAVQMAVFALAVACLFLAAPGTALAQSGLTTVQKHLCLGDPGGACTPISPGSQAPPNSNVYYEIRLGNLVPAPMTVSLNDIVEGPFSYILPAGFQCVDAFGNQLVNFAVSAQTPAGFSAEVNLGPQQQAICSLQGYFDTPASLAVNTASVGGINASVQRSVGSDPAPIPADLAISKTVLWAGHPGSGQAELDLSGGEGSVGYRIAIDRLDAGQTPIALHAFFRVIDQIRMAQTDPQISAEYIPASFECRNYDADSVQIGSYSAQDAGAPENCLRLILDLSAVAPTATGWSDLAVWGVGSGEMATLAPGGRLELDFEFRYHLSPTASCSSPEPQAIRNYAFLGLAGSHNVLSDQNEANNITSHDAATVPLVTGIQLECPSTPVYPSLDGISIEKLRWLPSDWPPLVTLLDDPVGWLFRAIQCLFEFFGSFLAVPWDDNYPWDSNREDVRYYIRVTNTTDSPITNIRLTDTVISLQDAAVPPFTAQLTDMHWLYCPEVPQSPWPILWSFINCSSQQPPPPIFTLGFNTPGLASNSATPGPALVPPGPGTLSSYGSTATLWMGRIARLLPGESAVLRIGINYRDPWCDAALDSDDKVIRNRIVATYEVFNEATQQMQPVAVASEADTVMERPQACNFNVVKEVAQPLDGSEPSNHIIFGQEFNYTVTYTNQLGRPQMVGTVIDALRIATPEYAPALSFRYRYACAPAQPGTVQNFSAFNNPNSSVPGFTEAQIQHVNQPNQGTRIITQPVGQSVWFGAGASLRCDITIIVDRPPLDNPWCLSSPTPELENLALMDVALFYNANFPWPPSAEGANWASVRTPLPRCYDLNLTKEVAPLSSGVTGPDLNYTVTVSNLGQGAVTGEMTPDGWFGPVLTDEFDTPYPLAGSEPVAVTDPCTEPQCDWVSGGVSQNPSVAAISTLPPGEQSLLLQYSLPPPYPFEDNRVCNTATLAMAFPTLEHTNLWYPRLTTDHVPITAQACGLILGEIDIHKEIISADPFIEAPSAVFPAQINCTMPNGQTLPEMAASLTPGQTTRVSGIPFGSMCTVSETPPAAIHGCVWEPSYPDGDAVTVTAGAPAEVRVVNTYVCPPTGSVRITKLLGNQSTIPLPEGPFTVNLTCTPPDGLGMEPLIASVLLSSSNTSQTVHGITAGSICTIEEEPPASPPGCLWEVTYPFGISAAIPANDEAVLRVGNTFHCLGTNTLSIGKQINNLSDQTAPSGPFEFEVTCTPPDGYGVGPDVRNVVIPANQSSALVHGVYVGSVCSAVEAPPANAAPGCWWETGFQGNGTAIISPTTALASITAINTYQCLPRRDVTVVKTVGADSDPFDVGEGFAIEAHCAPPQTSYGLGSTTANFSLAPGEEHVIQNVPVGSQCVAHEPPPPTEFGCVWQTDYPNGETISVETSGANVIEVRNTYSCERTGFIAVDKTFENGSPDVVSADMFAIALQIQPPVVVDVACQPPAGSQYSPLSAQQPRSVSNAGVMPVNVPMPLGSVCTVSEAPHPAVPEFCSWSAVYPDGPQAALDAEGEATVIRLVNVLSCDIDPPILTIRKERMSSDPNCTDCEFRITITNIGGLGYHGPLTVSDVAGQGDVMSGVQTPVAASLVESGDPSVWSCTQASAAAPINCATLSGVAIEPGETVTLDLRIQSNGWEVNCASLTTPDDGASSCFPRLPPVPDLGIEKTVIGCDIGGSCTYEITVTNHGPGTFYTPGMTLFDTFTTGSAVSGPVITSSLQLQCDTPSGVTICGGPNPAPADYFPEGEARTYQLTYQGVTGPLGAQDQVENCAAIFDPPHWEIWVQHWWYHHLYQLLMASGHHPQDYGHNVADALHAYLDDIGVQPLPGDFGDVRAALGPGFDMQNPPMDDPSNNRSCAPNFDPPDLQITKSQVEPACSGGECEFQITIVNNGDTAYSGPIQIVDSVGHGTAGSYGAFGTTIIPGLSGYSDPSMWECNETGGPFQYFICWLDDSASIPPNGGTITLNLTLYLPPEVPWDINCAVMVVPFGIEDNEACTPVTVLPPELEIEKVKLSPWYCVQGPGVSGVQNTGECLYRIRVTNVGSAEYAGPLTIADAFSFTGQSMPSAPFLAGTTFEVVSSEPEPWQCVESGQGPPIICEHPGVVLAPGEWTDLFLTINQNTANPSWNCAQLTSPHVVNAPPGGPFSCSPWVQLPPPSLGIAKEFLSDAPCNAAEPCSFRITVTNNGASDYQGPLVVHDGMGIGVDGAALFQAAGSPPQAPSWYVSHTPADWSCADAGGWPSVVCTHPNAAIPAGEAISFDLSIGVNPNQVPTVNCARLNLAFSLGAPAAGPISCVPVTSSPPSGLVIEKTQITSHCFGGDCVFRITVTNTGDSIYSGPLQISDAAGYGGPGSYWQQGSGSVVPPGLVAHHDPAVWSCQLMMALAWPIQCETVNPVTLAPNQSISVDLTLSLPPQVAWDINCARLNTPPGAEDACTSIGSLPELQIEKTHVSGDCRPSGSPCRYRITVINSGSQAFTGPLTVEEAFAFLTGGQDPFTSPDWPPAVIYDGSSPPDWNCAHTGSWPPVSCHHPGVTLPAGGSTSFEIDLRTNHPVPASRNCVRLSAPVVAGAPAGGPTACTPVHGEPPPAQLRIEKTGMGEALMPVGALSPIGYDFTLRVTNDGPAITGPHTVTVSDAAPEILQFHGVTANGWDCGPQSQFPLQHPNALTCEFTAAGGLSAGQTLPPIVIDAKLGPAAQMGNTFENCAAVALRSGTGPSEIQDEDCWHSDQNHVGPYDLAVQKTGALTGDEGSFTILVTNAGDDYHGHGTVRITDTAPAGMVFTGASGQGWSCTPVGSSSPFPVQPGQTLSCWHSAAPMLPAGTQLPALTVAVAVPDAAAGQTFENCANVTMSTSAGYFEATPDNNESCATVMVPPDFSGTMQPPQPPLPPTTPQISAPPPQPSCDPATAILRGGRCECRSAEMVRESAASCACPRGSRLEGGRCVTPPPACDPATTVLRDGACVCRFPDMMRADALHCACPAGTEFARGQGCIPSGPQCDPATTELRGGACMCRSEDMTRVDAARCACPPRHVFNAEAGHCTPLFCSPPMRLNEQRTACICPAGQVLSDGACRPAGQNLDRAIEILAPVIRDGARPPSRDPQPQPQPQPNPNCTPGGPVPC